MKRFLTKEQTEELLKLGISELYPSKSIQPIHIGGQVIIPDQIFTLIDLLEILQSDNEKIQITKSDTEWLVTYYPDCEKNYVHISNGNVELIDSLYEIVLHILKST